MKEIIKVVCMDLFQCIASCNIKTEIAQKIQIQLP